MNMQVRKLVASVWQYCFVLLLMVFVVGSAASAISWAGDVQLGENLYKKKCAICHGDKGQGAMAVKLNDPEAIKKKTDDEIKGVITDGRKGMPSYKSSLKSEEIDALVALIRSWAN